MARSDMTLAARAARPTYATEAAACSRGFIGHRKVWRFEKKSLKMQEATSE
jgi:hypothetical protein